MHKKIISQKKIRTATAKKNMINCVRCGTCCRKGGPALHKEDKKMLLDGYIGYENLITIRKGELAFSPVSGRLEPIEKELIKIAGKGKGWTCSFYDERESFCTIYAHRPLECRLLKCWDTAQLLSVIGKDTMTRADIISEDAPLMRFIKTHEEECSFSKTEELLSSLDKDDDPVALAGLEALVSRDLFLRSRAVSEFGLSLEAELFLFGRPLFKVLSSRGFQLKK